MDKTIEIVIVAMAILITATIVLFLVQDKTESFGGFLDNQKSGAQCKIWESKGECSSHMNECPEVCGTNSRPNPGSQCNSVSNRQSCEAAGVCKWNGGECDSK